MEYAIVNCVLRILSMLNNTILYDLILILILHAKLKNKHNKNNIIQI